MTSRCSIIAVLGAPNVGKSTLVNRLVGGKVSIVSPKAQTTRARVMGVCINGPAQLIFVDTPGIFSPRRRLDRAMVASAWGGAAKADATVLLVDSKKGLDKDTRGIIKGLKKGGGGGHGEAVLALNKIDLVKKPLLLDLAEALAGEALFDEIFMISAINGDGVDDLSAHFAGLAPKGPWLFPEDQLSDMPERLLAAEITREKLYLQLHHELPYAVAVETGSWREKDDGSVKIDQVIYVERASQKGIVLGKNGRRIKALGEAARRELEDILGRRVHLFLFVKVRKNWAESPERYRDLGLDHNV